jgi:hypothetical protein
MSERQRFAPTIVIDGRTVQPAGWMWVLGFALAGVPWAVVESETLEFRKRVADDLWAMRKAETQAEINALWQRIRYLRRGVES